MRLIWIIAKRELRGYFFSPIAFIFLMIFLISQMGFTFILGRFYDSNNADLEIFFTFQPWLYLFLVPAIGMRLWAEEKKEGTIEYLFTLPVNLYHLIIGKFLASWLFLAVALGLTFPIIFTVFFLGSPDFGPIFSGYFASWLMAGSFLAITSFTSALTKNQVISFVLSVIICFVLVLIGFGVFQKTLNFLPVILSDFITNFGFIPHFQQAMRGILAFRDIVYFLSISLFFMVLNAFVLDKNTIDAFARTGSKKFLNLTNIAILIVSLFSFNFIVSKINIKIDMTANKLYTLSEGSKKIVKSIDEEVTIKYFFSASNDTLPIMIKNYGKRVEELLHEFADYSGNLNVESFDPRPDSDEEELAAKYGIAGVQAGNEEPFYMGAAVLYQDTIHKIPFFDPRKETFLEYEIASLLAKLKNSAEKKVLGILAGFQMSSPQMPPQFARNNQQQDDWMFLQEFEKIFEIKKIDKTVEEIPEEVSLLLVFHPEGVSEATEYAIEQYILSGKRAVIVVDPSAKSVPKQNSPYAAYGMPSTTSSDLKHVFKALEVKYDSTKVVVDDVHATRVNSQNGPVRYPFWLSLNEESFNKDMVLTNQLNSVLFIETGFFGLIDGAKNTYTSLINSSSTAGVIDSQKLAFISPENFDDYDKIHKQLSLSGLVKGKFKSSFAGKPKDSKYSLPHINEADNENSVLIIGDVDFLNNQYSLRELNFFGQTMIQPINQNIVFASNVLEFISGSPDLISIRSRGTFSRPFERVEQIEQEAQAKWFNVEKELTRKIQQVQAKLNSLQTAKTEDNKLVLSAAQKREIENFKLEQIEFKKQRRDVRKNLRQDVERLGTILTVMNMTLIPLLVLVFGLYVYLRRSQGRDIFKKGVI